MKELDILEFLSENDEFEAEGAALRDILAVYQIHESREDMIDANDRGKVIYKLAKKNFKSHLVGFLLLYQSGLASLQIAKILEPRTLMLVIFLYWTAQKSIIALKFANGNLTSKPAFFEDVYDCLSLDDLQEFYEFFNGKLVRMSVISQNTDNNTILKICNNMMKRLSKSTFNELRGK